MNEQFIISSNDLVNQLVNTRWFAEHHNVTNIFCKAVLKQITSQHMGVRSPPPVWGPERSGPSLYHLEVTILNYRWKKNPTRGYKVKRPTPIYAGVKRYKVLSAQDLTGDGGWWPPSCTRWFAYRWKIKNIQDGNSLRIHSVSFSVVGLHHVPIWNFGVISAQTESAASIPFPKSQGSLSGQSPLLRLIKCRSKLISLLLPTPLPGSSLLPKPFPLQSEYPSQKDHRNHNRLRCSSMLICLASCKGKSWHRLKMIGDST